jgi:hypothetical protein
MLRVKKLRPLHHPLEALPHRPRHLLLRPSFLLFNRELLLTSQSYLPISMSGKILQKVPEKINFSYKIGLKKVDKEALKKEKESQPVKEIKQKTT